MLALQEARYAYETPTSYNSLYILRKHAGIAPMSPFAWSRVARRRGEGRARAVGRVGVSQRASEQHRHTFALATAVPYPQALPTLCQTRLRPTAQRKKSRQVSASVPIPWCSPLARDHPHPAATLHFGCVCASAQGLPRAARREYCPTAETTRASVR